MKRLSLVLTEEVIRMLTIRTERKQQRWIRQKYGNISRYTTQTLSQVPGYVSEEYVISVGPETITITHRLEYAHGMTDGFNFRPVTKTQYPYLYEKCCELAELADGSQSESLEEIQHRQNLDSLLRSISDRI